MPAIDIQFPQDGAIDVGVPVGPGIGFTAEGIVDEEMEVSGLVANTATGDVWLGDPSTQISAPDSPATDPDWYINFPAPGENSLPPTTELLLVLYATDGRCSSSILFTTAALPQSSGSSYQLAKSPGVLWDSIQINSVTRNGNHVTVSGQTIKKKAKVIVTLIGKTNLPITNPKLGPRRRMQHKRDKANNGNFTATINVQADTYRVVAMVRSGRKLATWPHDVTVP